MSAKITLNPNGPIKVEGDFQLVDAAGNAFGLGEKKVIFLCRCGATKNTPFCDGAHKSCSFEAPSQARDL
jgi:CDGSH-type Zn-finger protein